MQSDTIKLTVSQRLLEGLHFEEGVQDKFEFSNALVSANVDGDSERDMARLGENRCVGLKRSMGKDVTANRLPVDETCALIVDVEVIGQLRSLRGQPAKGVSGEREVRHKEQGKG